MRPVRSLPLILLLLPLWFGFGFGSSPALAAPEPMPIPTPVPNPYDKPSGAGAQPGVSPRRPPPPRPPTRRRPSRRQASDSENPVTQPVAPQPHRNLRVRAYSSGTSLRRLLADQSRARLKVLKNGRSWGIGFTVSGGVLMLAGGLSVFAPAGFIIMLTLVPIGGLAMISGIPLWATMQAIMNAERAALKRLRRHRIRAEPSGPLIATTPPSPPLQSRRMSAQWQLRF